MTADRFLGKTLDGRYEIDALLGSGGMGSVYKAKESALARFVAIKILLNHRLDDDESRLRFEREAEINANLSHEHIVKFYRFGISAEGFPYIATEYLEGITLKRRMSQSPAIGWREAATMAVQILRALEAAHKQGIVHRDLKPENLILISSSSTSSSNSSAEAAPCVKIVDFGLSKTICDPRQDAQNLTRTGELIGSVLYMSPEQCQGKKPDHRADLYSLSCILYEILADTPPFLADNPMGVVFQHANSKAKPLDSYQQASKIPRQLLSIIEKGMHKEPQERYQTASEFCLALEALLNEEKPELLSGKQSFGLKQLAVSAIAAVVLLSAYYVFVLRKNTDNKIRELTKGSQGRSDRNAQRYAELRAKQIKRYEHDWQRAQAAGDTAQRDAAALEIIKLAMESTRNLYYHREYAQAAKFAQLAKSYKSKTVPIEAWQLMEMGVSQSSCDLYAAAERSFVEALERCKELGGVPHREALIYCRRSVNQLKKGNPRLAAEYFAEASSRWKGSIHTGVEARVLKSASGAETDNIRFAGAPSAQALVVWSELNKLKWKEADYGDLLVLVNHISRFLLLKKDAMEKLPQVLAYGRQLADTVATESAASNASAKAVSEAYLVSADFEEKISNTKMAAKYRQKAGELLKQLQPGL